MDFMKETTLTHWTELSLATKTLLQEKHALKLIQSPKAFELLAEVSRVISAQKLHNSLLLTLNISDAILIRMLLAKANPELKLHLILADTPDTQIHFNQADITIIPYPLFSLERIRKHALPLLDLDLIMIDEAIPANFLHDLLFIDELNRSLLAIDNETLLLATDFTQITKAVTADIHYPEIKSPKISLKKTPSVTDEKPLSSQKADRKKPSKRTQKEDSTNNTEKVVNVEPTTENASSSAKTTNSVHQIATLPEAPFIALVPKNLQRQYVRDYIRAHHLQHLLIVAHNRQSARLLEKYLYRARIRSRIVHEKINEETADSLFERYNKGQFSVLILMHRVIEEFASKITQCDSVMFLDFPTVYAEYAERFAFIQNHYQPAHFISIATENDKAWIHSFTEEYPQLGLPIIPIDITPPKRREPKEDSEKKADQHNNTATRNTSKKPRKSKQSTHSDEPQTQASETNTQTNQENEAISASPSDTSTTNQDAKPNKGRAQKNRKPSKRTRPQADVAQKTDNSEEEKRNGRRSASTRGQARNNQNSRNDRRNNKSYNNHQPTGDSQSDFFGGNQDEIVNRNRLPFESGSFEANIARENRRRGRDPFGVPGGIGQSTNGNFIQNITQGYGNGNGGNGNGNSENQRKTQRRPRTKNNRKK